MSHEQPEQPHRGLHDQDLNRESILPLRTKPHQPEVQKREIRTRYNHTLLIPVHAQEVQFMQQRQEEGDVAFRRVCPLRDRRFHESCPCVEARETVARTGDQTEELRGGVDEVEDLWDEEQEEGFREVTADTYDGEDHAGEVAVGVPYEDFGWVPVVAEESERDADEGEEHV